MDIKRSTYAVNANLVVRNSRICHAAGKGSRAECAEIAGDSLLTTLEVFFHENDVQNSFKAFKAASSPDNLRLAITGIQRLLNRSEPEWDKCVLTITEKKFELSLPSALGTTAISLGSISRKTHRVLSAIQRYVKPGKSARALNTDRTAFERNVDILVGQGILVPPVGSLNWGDFKRVQPFCNSFGWSRGTPIDRYYLEQFVRRIRSEVLGTTLEIGGKIENKKTYGFSNAAEYRVLDLGARPGGNIIGDAHDENVVSPESFDSIIAFNVLEHCAEPWAVVENMRRWLKPGGKAFCMVPNAQRIHDLPADYWRPLPAAMESMFKKYSKSRLFVYGNPLTLTASFQGIAHEELSRAELDSNHPDFPVATCIVAEK